MSNFQKITQFLKQRKVPLKAYQDFLNYSTSSFDSITRHLLKKGVSLPELRSFLTQHLESKEDLKSSLTTLPKYLEMVEQIGLDLLQRNQISLKELNILVIKLQQARSFNLTYFLKLLYKEEFLNEDEFIQCTTQSYNPFYRQISPFELRQDDFHFLFHAIPQKLDSSQKIGNYQILKEIGRGGMGAVYKVFHPQLQRFFALKVLLLTGNTDATKLQRFHREVQSMAKLNHPGIVQIIDSGREGRKHYLVMEYVAGQTLKGYRGKTIWEAISLVQQILEALEYAHQQGIIHRDLKPENLFVTEEGAPKIGDFGLSKGTLEETSRDQKITKTGAVLGTILYMAPEQANGLPADTRSDIYSIGACLYEFLTGHSPHEDKTQTGLWKKILVEDCIPPSKWNKNLHPDLDTIICKALDKKPDRRYQSALKFGQDLNRFLLGLPIEAKGLPLSSRLFKWAKKNQNVCLFLLFPLLSLLIFSLYLTLSERSLKREKLQQWIQKVDEVRQFPPTTSLSNREKMKRLLQALHLLNRSLESLPKNPQLEKRKWEVGLALTKQSLQDKNFILMHYVTQELQDLNTIEPKLQKKLLELTKEKQSQYLQTQEKAFLNWYERLQTETFEPPLTQDAQFGILNVLIPSNTEKLITLVQEGTFYHLNSKPKRKRSEIYSLLVKILGRSRTQRAAEVLLDSLQQLAEKNEKIPPFQRSEPVIFYMIHLSEALANTRVKGISKAFRDARNLMGDGLYWTQTIRAYRILAGIDGVSESIAITPADYVERAYAKQLTGDFEGAIRDYDMLLNITPRDPKAFCNRGWLKFEIQKYQEAMEDFSRAIQLKSDYAKAYGNRCLALMELGQTISALKDVERAIALAPQTAEFYLNRGILYFNNQKHSQALQDFTRCIELSPYHGLAYYNRGNAYARLSQFENALYDFQKAIELDPQNEEAHLNLGVLFTKMNMPDKAIESYTQAIEVNPQYGIAYANRAFLKSIRGDLVGALPDYEIALKLDPKNSDAVFNRAVTYYQLNQPLPSQKDFQKFLQLTSQNQDLETQQKKEQIYQIFPTLRR